MISVLIQLTANLSNNMQFTALTQAINYMDILDIICFFIILPVFIQLVDLARGISLLLQVKTLHNHMHFFN